MDGSAQISARRSLRVAVEGCGHGTLDAIYASVQKSCEIKGWDGVDLVIICGDFQAVRDRLDLNVTAMPAKYREMADFHKYYWGTKHAPYLTVFIGGNHEASNHLWELYYGGWVAPNIYYLGAANVIRFGPIKIAGLSGIWKGYDYRKPHYERLPYNEDNMYSIYHVRELDTRKLLAYRSQVDIGLSHDWPHGIELLGDKRELFRKKGFLQEDSDSGKLGNIAAEQVLDHLRPTCWFSAHLHTRYTAVKRFPEKSHDASKPSLVPSNGNLNVESRRSHSDNATTHESKIASPAQNQEKVSAWQNFHVTAKKNEAEENAQALEDQRIRREEAERTGVSHTPGNVYNEFYKKVKLADGFSRAVTSVSQSRYQSGENIDGLETKEEEISQYDGCCSSVPVKRRRSSDSIQPVLSNTAGVGHTPLNSDGAQDAPEVSISLTNPDAIDLDLSDDDDEGEDELATISAAVTTHHSDARKEPHESDNTLKPPITSQLTAPSQDVRNTEIVDEEMRAKLAALSPNFADKKAETPSQPLPNEIDNTITKFLALSKCVPGQEFLQLLEIEPVTKSAETGKLRPQLQYDPEWLAILRVFATELALGGEPTDLVPRHQGDAYYRDRIITEEKWVHENIVAKDLLDVPLNFEITLPQSDPTINTNQSDMPLEGTNPQTTAFCNLIGIKNKFDFPDEERQARRNAGPRPSQRQTRGHGGPRGNGRGRGDSSGHRGRSFKHRGRGRGRGRGFA